MKFFETTFFEMSFFVLAVVAKSLVVMTIVCAIFDVIIISIEATIVLKMIATISLVAKSFSQKLGQ